jgi:4-amino-4-deoxy-L-arabinose transferase-like glycosyltransferase
MSGYVPRTGWRPGRSWPRLSPLNWLAAIIVAAVAIRLPFALGGLIDYDEGVYWQSLRAMSAGHGLYTEVYSSQPPAFLAGLFPGYSLLGHSFLAVRMVMLLWSALAIVAAFFAGRALLGTRTGLFAAVLLAVDPIVLRQSVVIQAEGPAITLGLIAVGYAAKARIRGGREGDAYVLVAGVALALGVLTKILDVAAAAPVAVLLVAPAPAVRSAPLRRCAVAAVGALLATAAVLLPLADRWRAVLDQSVGLHLASHALDEGGWTVDMFQTAAREGPLALLAVAGAALLLRRAPLVLAALAAWLALALATLALVHPLWPHHLSAAVPPLVIAGGAALDAVAGAPRRVVAAGGALAVAGVLVALGVEARLLRMPPQQTAPDAVVAVLASATAAGDVLVTDDQYALASADRDVPPPLVDTSVVRIVSEPLTTQAVEDAAIAAHARGVFFATGRLQHLAGLREWAATRFPDVHDFGDGRVLYLSRG